MNPKKLVFVLISIVVFGTGLWLSWGEVYGQRLSIYDLGFPGRRPACGEVVLRSEDRAVRNARFTPAYLSYTESTNDEPPVQKREDQFTYQGMSYDAMYCNAAFLSYSRKYYYTVPEANVRACLNTVHFGLPARITADLSVCQGMKDVSGAKLIATQTSWPALFIDLAMFLLLPAIALTYIWLKYLSRATVL